MPIKIKEDLDGQLLRNLGYTYDVMEGGYISENAATIIYKSRKPYERQVDQYRGNAEAEHALNVEVLRQADALV